jgi:hypothetical protein
VADFSEFEERGATQTGRLLATIDKEIGKIGSALRVAGKIVPYRVVGLDFGTTKACGLRLVWHNFPSQRCTLV